MILAWAVQALAVSVVVALLVRALGPRAPRLRYALLAVLAAKLVVPPSVTAPTAAWGRGSGRLAETIERVAPGTLTPRWRGDRVRVPDRAATGGDEAAPGPARRGAAGTWLLAVYVVGAAVRAAALARETRRLAHLARAARPLHLGAPGGARVAESADVAAPIAFGVRRPTVLLPVDVTRALDPRVRGAVLVHELAHLRHRDPLANVVLALLTAAWWFHPAAWWLAREARRVQEDLVDDAVVRAGLDAEAYCGALLDVARATRRRPAASPLASGTCDREHALARRFRRVLTPESPRRRTTEMLLRLLPVTLAATLLPGAAVPAFQDPGRDPGHDPVSDGFADAKPPLERALGWLAAHQQEDGRFLLAADSPAGDAADALALLAFLGAGHTAQVGPHRQVVARGLARMEARYDAPWSGALTLADAAGALFLSEVSLLSGTTSPALEGALARLAQGLADTGEHHVDPAVAFWAALALISGADAGFEADGGTLAAALGHVPLEGEAASATGWTREHTTAAALLLHFLTGGARDEARAVAAIDRVAAAGAAGADATLLHLGSYALFQAGGDAWQRWRERTLPRLDAGQGEEGAWPSEANVPGGSVGATALRALGLEVMWRYARVVGGR